MIFLDIGDAPLQRINIIENRLRRAHRPAQHIEAMRSIMFELTYFIERIYGARNVVLDIGRNLVFSEFLHKRLVPTIISRYSFRPNDKHVLHAISSLAPSKRRQRFEQST